MPRPHYLHVPYFAGAVGLLARTIRGAGYQYKRFAIFGDSQETDDGSGAYYVPALNLEAYSRFGCPTETPLFGGLSQNTRFLQTVVGAGCSADSIAVSSAKPQLPGHPWIITDGTAYGMLHVLAWRGQNNPVTNVGGTSPIFDQSTGSVVYDLFIKKRSGGPTDVQIVETTATTAGTYSGTLNTNHTSSGLSLNSTNSGFATFTTAPLTYQPTRPYFNIWALGWNGSAVVAGLQTVGARYRNTATSRGCTFTSFSVGGQNTQSLFTAYGGGGEVLRYCGPWDAVFIQICVNDIAIGGADAYKASMQAFINTLRGSTWLNNSNQLIVLVQDPPIGTRAQTQLDAFAEFGAVGVELARSNTNVCFVNLGRRIYEMAGADSPAWTSDGVHMTTEGSINEAKIFWEMLDEIAL